jgi:hypothetical protein
MGLGVGVLGTTESTRISLRHDPSRTAKSSRGFSGFLPNNSFHCKYSFISFAYFSASLAHNGIESQKRPKPAPPAAHISALRRPAQKKGPIQLSKIFALIDHKLYQLKEISGLNFVRLFIPLSGSSGCSPKHRFVNGFERGWLSGLTRLR